MSCINTYDLIVCWDSLFNWCRCSCLLCLLSLLWLLCFLFLLWFICLWLFFFVGTINNFLCSFRESLF
ncbi:MAG TPA: hypothetical protein DCX18_00310 [Erysipelotrichaceae bacterium]|nr:hypothetical protein [Erysipelotrichaceae bacterium]